VTVSQDGDFIHVDYGHVTDVYDALVHATEQIKQIIENLENEVKPLEASWIGVSRDEYSGVKVRYTNDTANMSQTLGNSAGTLSEMSYNYQSTDKNLAFSWQDILPG